MNNDELLDKKLTYHEFCDIATDGWLKAEEDTKEYPSRKFQHELWQYIEDNVKAKFEL